uniref:Protein kinase domain-containing protein n=1 Tax=Panagrellus redivivus TaxID=6233 RepID=A0A7E4W429_PANRE
MTTAATTTETGTTGDPQLTNTTNNTATTTTNNSSSSESRKKPEFELGSTVFGKWKVLSELGRGGCGVVYCVERVDGAAVETHPKAALKAEYILKNYSETLAAEANVLRKLQWSRYVCRLYAAGRVVENVNVVCMSLAGPSLSWLRRRCPQQRMTFSSALRIAFHCLNAIEDLHCIGFIHRDIKASNFAVGYYSDEARDIRILDFGFARAYLSYRRDGTLGIRRPRARAPFLGTDRYCSPNVHKRNEQGRVDDCWSWLFMLVELMYGKLPWRDVSSKRILQAKEDALPTLFRHGPLEMYTAIDHLSALSYESRPDYDHLRGIISDICRKRGFKFRDPYDWEAGGVFAKAFEMPPADIATAQEPSSIATARNIADSPSQKSEKFDKGSPVIMTATATTPLPTAAMPSQTEPITEASRTAQSPSPIMMTPRETPKTKDLPPKAASK